MFAAMRIFGPDFLRILHVQDMLIIVHHPFLKIVKVHIIKILIHHHNMLYNWLFLSAQTATEYLAIEDT